MGGRTSLPAGSDGPWRRSLTRALSASPPETSAFISLICLRIFFVILISGQIHFRFLTSLLTFSGKVLCPFFVVVLSLSRYERKKPTSTRSIYNRLTIPSNQMTEFVGTCFAILDYADIFIAKHNESTIRESAEIILETYSPKYILTCEQHSEKGLEFA